MATPHKFGSDQHQIPPPTPAMRFLASRRGGDKHAKCSREREKSSLLLSNSMDELSQSSRSANTRQVLRKVKLPRFRRLVEYEGAKTPEYEPPPKTKFFEQDEDELQKAAKNETGSRPKVRPSSKKTRNRKTRFQRLESKDSDWTVELKSTKSTIKKKKSFVAKKAASMDTQSCSDSSHGEEYEPPRFSIGTMQSNEKEESPTLNQIVVQETTGKGYANLEDGPFSPSPPNVVVAEPEKSPQSESSTPNTTQEAELFRQFVFDESFSRIEKVTVERSDAGASDFAGLAGKLATKLTPVKLTPVKQEPTPKLQDTVMQSAEKAKASFKKSASLRSARKAKMAEKGRTEISPKRDKPCEFSRRASCEPIHFPQNEQLGTQQNIDNVSIGFSSVNIDDIDWGMPTSTKEQKQTMLETIPSGDLTKDTSKAQAASKNGGDECQTKREVEKSVSMDDALIESIKKSSEGSEERSVKPDPSPRATVSSDTALEDRHKSSMRKLMSPQQLKPRQALANDVILGSMLFRHTNPTLPEKHLDVDECDEEGILGSIPQSILAEGCSEVSIVSSVTDDTASFYQKRFGWDKQAQSVLNHYHKLRNGRDPNQYRADKALQSVQEEHLKMFQA